MVEKRILNIAKKERKTATDIGTLLIYETLFNPSIKLLPQDKAWLAEFEGEEREKIILYYQTINIILELYYRSISEFNKMELAITQLSLAIIGAAQAEELNHVMPDMYMKRHDILEDGYNEFFSLLSYSIAGMDYMERREKVKVYYTMLEKAYHNLMNYNYFIELLSRKTKIDQLLTYQRDVSLLIDKLETISVTRVQLSMLIDSNHDEQDVKELKYKVLQEVFPQVELKWHNENKIRSASRKVLNKRYIDGNLQREITQQVIERKGA